MICYRRATPEDLEIIWNYNIRQNPGEPRNQRWKESFIERNLTGIAVTYVIVANEEPVGEVTLDFVAESYGNPSVRHKLGNGKDTAYVTALRIRKEYEGKGLVSGLMKYLETSAKLMGFRTLTIGVEAAENRNRAIYHHWGYDQPVLEEMDDGELVLFYAKEL